MTGLLFLPLNPLFLLLTQHFLLHAAQARWLVERAAMPDCDWGLGANFLLLLPVAESKVTVLMLVV